METVQLYDQMGVRISLIAQEVQRLSDPMPAISTDDLKEQDG